MNSSEMIGDLLIIAGKRIKAGKCVLYQEQLDAIFSEIERVVDVPVSKETACGLLGISRSRFDAKVAAGELPAGVHRRGFKEKMWYKREILRYR